MAGAPSVRASTSTTTTASSASRTRSAEGRSAAYSLRRKLSDVRVQDQYTKRQNFAVHTTGLRHTTTRSVRCALRARAVTMSAARRMTAGRACVNISVPCSEAPEALAASCCAPRSYLTAEPQKRKCRPHSLYPQRILPAPHTPRCSVLSPLLAQAPSLISAGARFV